jgi:hypothetical protein
VEFTIDSDALNRHLIMTRPIALLVVFSCAFAGAAQGQSLAEVARQEEVRRKAVKDSGKVYTNTDLRPDITKTPAAAAAATADGKAPPDAGKADADGKAAGQGDKAKTDEPVKDQAYWSRRIGDARAALERSRIFADALQSRLNALTADFVNRDDPAQRAQIELERKRATSELERVTKEIAEGTKAIADIEEEARKAGVPPGWLR